MINSQPKRVLRQMEGCRRGPETKRVVVCGYFRGELVLGQRVLGDGGVPWRGADGEGLGFKADGLGPSSRLMN